MMPEDVLENIKPADVLLEKMPVRYPLNGTFELTVRCNLHCKMCLFRHDDSENPVLLAGELTTGEWIDMARQAAEAGTLSLLITGGEPMLRPDFCEIWEGIYQYGFFLELYTNATLVNDRIMETLRKYPPHKIGVTIYGASPEIYEKVCGNAGAYYKAIEGMKQLQSLSSELSFRATIIKDNFRDLPNIEALVGHEFGMPDSLTTARLVNKAVRGGCADAGSSRLDPEKNVEVAYFRGIERIKSIIGSDYDERKLRIKIKEKQYPDSNCVSGQGKLSLFGCNAGMSEYAITWDGKMLGCQMMGCFYTDARREGFGKAWERYPYIVEQPVLNDKCSNCSELEICSNCSAVRYAECGDPGGCPEYICKDTHTIRRLMKGGIYDEKHGE